MVLTLDTEVSRIISKRGIYKLLIPRASPCFAVLYSGLGVTWTGFSGFSVCRNRSDVSLGDIEVLNDFQASNNEHG